MVRSLALAPDGITLAAGGMQHSVFLVDHETGASHELRGHVGPVVGLAFAEGAEQGGGSGRDRGQLLVSSAGAATMVWSTAGLLTRAPPPKVSLIL